MISFDELLDQIERARERDEQWRRLAAEVERREQLHDELIVEKERSAAASVAKTNFLANISHEIRTPLSAVIGLVDVLLETGDISRAPEQRLLTLESIKRNSSHLLAVIEDILDLAKLEAGRSDGTSERFCPLEVAREVCELLGHQAAQGGLSLELRPSGRLPVAIVGDRTRLVRILMNLVGNALKFTERGSVTVELTLVEDERDPRLRFAVRDTGIGIAPGELDRLFEPFEQADNSSSRRYSGTGLGLAICRNLAELLGGRLEAESEPGRGSVFTLELPTGSLEGLRVVEEDEQRRTLAASPSAPDERFERRVLVAEDSGDNQRVILHILERVGAEVEMVGNGELAIERAQAAEAEGDPFSVILMDMQMPVLDGYTAARRLRREGYTGAIVALTAHAMDGEQQRCLEAGCDGYETKPIQRERLLATMRRLAASEKDPEGD